MEDVAEIERGTAGLIHLNPRDSVAVARTVVEPGTLLDSDGLTAIERIGRGHKVALRNIATGEPVLKYGQIIGRATQAIPAGALVHTNNLAISELTLTHEFCADATAPELLPEASRATFMGYARPDGRVGTRNYIAVISSVNCSATVVKAIAAHFSQPGQLEAWPNVDGVIALAYGGGCAFNTKGEGYKLLTRTIAGYATHPNVGGVLMVGLGCETNQIPELMRRHGLAENNRLRTFTIQGVGGTRRTIEQGVTAVTEMLPLVNEAQRSRQSAEHLTLALECGGSDGYSGISANPALGHAADLLVRHGGTAVLSETPEIYGAEHLLTRRARSPEVARKLLDRIDWWRSHAAQSGAEMDNNPSHGNKAGGLTTILEKSLGAVAKGGSTRLNAVYEYAERIEERGFVFMDTPGYDPVAVTGQIAGGCNLICFTTGRGSVSGFKPTPSLKLATNTAMYERMAEDMDINCGTIVTGEETVTEVGERIFQLMLESASGRPTASESFGYGDNEFVPWQIDAVM